jgi:hypothetical protein
MEAPLTVQWEKVYVFVSSTFNDMHAERDDLVKQLFPPSSSRPIGTPWLPGGEAKDRRREAFFAYVPARSPDRASSPGHEAGAIHPFRSVHSSNP